MSDRDDHDDYDDGGNPDRVDRDESVEPGDWGGDAAENTMATASGDATAEPEHRRADAGIDAVVAPWETGHGKGGPVRATIEVFASILLAAIAAIVLIFAGLFGYVILTGGAEPGLVAGLLLSLVGSQAGFALVAYGFLRYRGESIRNLGIAVPDFKQSVLVVVGVVGAFVLAIAAGSAVQALGLEAAENSTAAAASEVPSSFLLLIPVAILVVGPCEELLFRGVVQRRFREVASAPVAIVVASALFAAVHVVALQGGLAARLTSIAVLFFPSLLFGVLYEYTKNVVVTSLVHGLYDAVLFGLLYLVFTFAPEGAEGGQSVVAFAVSLL
jgi:hypothetical protein